MKILAKINDKLVSSVTDSGAALCIVQPMINLKNFVNISALQNKDEFCKRITKDLLIEDADDAYKYRSKMLVMENDVSCFGLSRKNKTFEVDELVLIYNPHKNRRPRTSLIIGGLVHLSSWRKFRT